MNKKVNPPGPLLYPAPLLVLHEVPPEALEPAPLAPAPLGELEGRDGLLHRPVADPVAVGGRGGRAAAVVTVVAVVASREGAVGRARRAALAGEVALGALEHLVARNCVAGHALEYLPQFLLHPDEFGSCHCVKVCGVQVLSRRLP